MEPRLTLLLSVLRAKLGTDGSTIPPTLDSVQLSGQSSLKETSQICFTVAVAVVAVVAGAAGAALS
jgi:hypothetical protein